MLPCTGRINQRKDQNMKKLLLLAACLCGAYLSAESVILTPENCVIKPYKNSGTAEYKDGAWIINGPVRILSKEKFAVDDTKKYRLSGSVRALDGSKKSTLCIGFIPLTAKGQDVSGMHVWHEAKGYGTLAEAVKAGDTVIKVRPDADSTAWSKSVKNFHLAVDAKKDLSDLPNHRLYMLITKSEMIDGVLHLTMARQVTFASPAGTAVRLHRGGGDSMHAAFSGAKYTDQLMPFAGTVTGRINGWHYRIWPVNVTHCRVQVLANWIEKESKIEIRDLKLDILP